MRGLNKWLMVQVYAIAHIAVNLEFHIFILFPPFLAFCNVLMFECMY